MARPARPARRPSASLSTSSAGRLRGHATTSWPAISPSTTTGRMTSQAGAAGPPGGAPSPGATEPSGPARARTRGIALTGSWAVRNATSEPASSWAVAAMRPSAGPTSPVAASVRITDVRADELPLGSRQCVVSGADDDMESPSGAAQAVPLDLIPGRPAAPVRSGSGARALESDQLPGRRAAGRTERILAKGSGETAFCAGAPPAPAHE